MKVPWMEKAAIACAAANVIADFEAATDKRIEPPIPVDDIIEFGLDLELGFEDLRRKLNLEDVLGATYVQSRKICADISLVRTDEEGRLCFTLAHEAGHWVLHREWIGQASPGRGFIFCRSRDAKKPIEWQADYFAACLLMPEACIKDAFIRVCGPQPLVLHNVESAYSGPICFDPCVANWPAIADCVRRAGNFLNVSKQAMIIRLQELGWVRNETRSPMAWRSRVAA
ncbi:MAG: ImmA/IrrE family metallo-endopeptidase [Hyphomicrobiales bacterium]